MFRFLGIFFALGVHFWIIKEIIAGIKELKLARLERNKWISS